MPERLSKEGRSRLMSRVRREHTAPEMAIRKVAHSLGLRFRLHRQDLPGKPDLVFPRWNVALFVHGCFWHQHQGCARAKLPQNNHEYWKAKFTRNVQRDALASARLKAHGWKVLVIWECIASDEEALHKVFGLKPFNRKKYRPLSF